MHGARNPDRSIVWTPVAPLRVTLHDRCGLPCWIYIYPTVIVFHGSYDTVLVICGTCGRDEIVAYRVPRQCDHASTIPYYGTALEVANLCRATLEFHRIATNRGEIIVQNVHRKSPTCMYVEGDSGDILGVSPLKTTPQCLSEDSVAGRDIRERGEKLEEGSPTKNKERSGVGRPNQRLVSWKERKRRLQPEIPRQQHESSGENPAGVRGVVGTGGLSHEPENVGGSDNITHNEGGTENGCFHNKRTSGNDGHIDDSRTPRKSPLSPPLRLGSSIHFDRYSNKDDDGADTQEIAESPDVPLSTHGDTADSDTDTPRTGRLNSASNLGVLDRDDDPQPRGTTKGFSGTEHVAPGSETGEGSGGDTSVTPITPGSSSSHGHHPPDTVRSHKPGGQAGSTGIAVSWSSRYGVDDVAMDRSADRCGGSRVLPRRSDHKEVASVDKLRSLLRKEKEEKAKQREGKEVAKREAKMALASLEANAKRCVPKLSYLCGMTGVFVSRVSLLVVGHPVFRVFSTSLLLGRNWDTFYGEDTILFDYPFYPKHGNG